MRSEVDGKVILALVSLSRVSIALDIDLPGAVGLVF